MNVLICNAGSSSLKFSLVEAQRERTLAQGGVDWAAVPARLTIRRDGQAAVHAELTVPTHAPAVVNVLHELLCGPSAPPHGPNHIHAVGYRVVHGGDHSTSAVRVTPEIRRGVLALSDSAPPEVRARRILRLTHKARQPLRA